MPFSATFRFYFKYEREIRVTHNCYSSRGDLRQRTSAASLSMQPFLCPGTRTTQHRQEDKKKKAKPRELKQNGKRKQNSALTQKEHTTPSPSRSQISSASPSGRAARRYLRAERGGRRGRSGTFRALGAESCVLPPPNQPTAPRCPPEPPRCGHPSVRALRERNRQAPSCRHG